MYTTVKINKMVQITSFTTLNWHQDIKYLEECFTNTVYGWQPNTKIAIVMETRRPVVSPFSAIPIIS